MEMSAKLLKRRPQFPPTGGCCLIMSSVWTWWPFFSDFLQFCKSNNEPQALAHTQINLYLFVSGGKQNPGTGSLICATWGFNWDRAVSTSALLSLVSPSMFFPAHGIQHKINLFDVLIFAKPVRDTDMSISVSKGLVQIYIYIYKKKEIKKRVRWSLMLLINISACPSSVSSLSAKDAGKIHIH